MRLDTSTSTVWYFPPEDANDRPRYSINVRQADDVAHDLKEMSIRDVLRTELRDSEVRVFVSDIDAGGVDQERLDEVESMLEAWNAGLKAIKDKSLLAVPPAPSRPRSRRSRRVNSQPELASDDPLTKVTDFLSRNKDRILSPTDISVRILTWNLHGEPLYEKETFEDFSKLLKAEKLHDIYICGFQETIPLTAKNLHHSPVAIEGWCNILLDTLKRLDSAEEYRILSTNALLGLTTIVVTKQSLFEQFSRVESRTIGTGLLGVWGNKGAIMTKFVVGADFSAGIEGLTFQHINCHLAAGESAAALLRRRTELYDIEHRFGLVSDKVSLAVYEDKEIFEGSLESLVDDPRISLDYSSDEDDFLSRESIDKARLKTETAVQNLTLEDDESVISENLDGKNGIVFISGDLNYRISLSPEIAENLVKKGNYTQLLENDSLAREKREENIFIGMKEGEIAFMPTYKFVDNTDDYAYLRTPSYTDRVLFSDHETLEQTHYSSVPELRSSDHRPVISDFKVRVPYINMAVRKTLLAGYYKELDTLENNSRPDVTVSPLDLIGEVKILTPFVVSTLLKNNGDKRILWRVFDTSGETLNALNGLDKRETAPRKRQQERSKFVTEPITITPASGTLPAGATQKIEIQACAPISADKLEGVYILRVGDGQDFFLSYKFAVLPTFLGKSVESLIGDDKRAGLPENVCIFTDFLMDHGFPEIFTRALDWSSLDTLNSALVLSSLEQEIISDINSGKALDYELIEKFDSISGQRREGTRSVANVFYLLMRNLKDGVIPINMSVYLINTYYKDKKSIRTRDVLVTYLLDTISPGRANLLIFLCSFFRHLYEQKGVSIAIIYGIFENLLIPLPKISKIRMLSTSNFRALRKRRRELLNVLILD